MSGVATYLSHTGWYARVAAASCLESLARLECGQEDPSCGRVIGEEGCGGAAGGGDELTDELARGWVVLGDVRLSEVLERGALLLSRGDDVSEGRWLRRECWLFFSFLFYCGISLGRCLRLLPWSNNI